MMRLGSLMMAMALGVGLSAGPALAEQEAPRRLVAPVRGEAAVEITAPNTRVTTKEVITTFRVKNVSPAPIAGFRVEENWFKGNTAIGGDIYRHPRPFRPDEVIEITLSVPRDRVVGARNQYQFSHANGTIKPTTVKSLELTKPPTEG